jgi:hypothetical protein
MQVVSILVPATLALCLKTLIENFSPVPASEFFELSFLAGFAIPAVVIYVNPHP